ncbi:chloride channel protein [Wolbachia endosymbiont of Mansonella ozzardi]|uniref:chloride channel protein n=1 Tax=Wolbachia endosymbiont of Mansonella ozzardi TaxID=137464 RepID=UPI001CE0FD4C
MLSVASTLPVPAGIFMPAFVIGAAISRFIRELIALADPIGFRNNQQLLILPDVYSVAVSILYTASFILMEIHCIIPLFLSTSCNHSLYSYR